MQNSSAPISIEMGDEFGEDFFLALQANVARYRAFEERGSRVSLPPVDRRYGDMAALQLTSYMNLDRGLIPQYGAGKFYNEVTCVILLANHGMELWKASQEPMSLESRLIYGLLNYSCARFKILCLKAAETNSSPSSSTTCTSPWTRSPSTGP